MRPRPTLLHLLSLLVPLACDGGGADGREGAVVASPTAEERGGAPEVDSVRPVVPVGSVRDTGDPTDEEGEPEREVHETPEDARARLERRFETVEAELAKAVEVGALTREVADVRLADVRRAIEDEVREVERLVVARQRFAEAAAEVERRVAEGVLARSDADAELEGLRRSHGLSAPRSSVAYEEGPLDEAELRVLREELQRAVVAGELTRREMLERLAELEARVRTD